MNSTHNTTGDISNISSVNSYNYIKYIEGFTPFCIDKREALFSFVEGTKVPKMELALYEFIHEGAKGFLPPHFIVGHPAAQLSFNTIFTH